MGENLATTLTALTSVTTAIMGQVSSIVSTITSTPLLFIPFGVSITFTIIGVTKRLFRRH